VRSLELAIKYLAGERIIGTAAERATMTTLGTAGWTQMDAGESFTINTSTGKIDFDLKGGSIDNLYYDLGTVSDSAWQVRMIINFTSGASNNTNNGDQYLRFGITNESGSQTGGNNNASNGANMAFADHHTSQPSNERWEIHADSSTSSSLLHGTTTGVDYYITFKRTASSGSNNVSADVKTVSHTGTSLTGLPLTEDLTDTGSTHLYFANRETSGGSLPIAGTIRALQVWKDSAGSGSIGFEPTFTNSYPNLSNGTLFEESDTGKHYMFDGTDTWNEMS